MSQINHDTVPDNLPTCELAPSNNDFPPQSNEVDILKKQVALLESAVCLLLSCLHSPFTDFYTLRIPTKLSKWLPVSQVNVERQ